MLKPSQTTEKGSLTRAIESIYPISISPILNLRSNYVEVN